RTLMRCRTLYNIALEQRITAWQRCHVSVSRFEQEAELKAIRAELPEYAAIHSHLLQDVLARLDVTSQAFFRRVYRGERAGFPRFKGRDRFHSFTFKEYGSGASLCVRRVASVAVLRCICSPGHTSGCAAHAPTSITRKRINWFKRM